MNLLYLSRVMRIVILLLTCGFMYVSATTYSQQITLRVKNASLREVIAAIKTQTGFEVSGPSSVLQKAKPISVNVQNVSLERFLELAFKNQPLQYTLGTKSIILSNKINTVTSNRSAAVEAVENMPIVQEVRGRVIDSLGNPLEKASIRVLTNSDPVRGVTIQTLTDRNGYFILENVPEGATLLISFLGYQEQKVRAKTDMGNIVLKVLANTIEELVVMGYTAKPSSELTGAVQKVSGDELRSSVATPNALSMLKGKTTGLYITENSGDAGAKGQVIERGQSSMATPTNSYFGPLIVVDGVITNYTSLLDAVNPSDVEDITILKDASSTAIYGSRAAQGVIVVTTKRGQAGKTTVDARVQYGGIQPVRDIRFMNTTELIDFMDKQMNRYWEQTPSIRETYPDVNQFIRERRVYNDEDRNRNFSWEDAIYSNGNFHNTEVAISHGTEKTKLYAGIAWNKENGAKYDNSFDRKSLRLNLDHAISSRLQATLNISSIVDRTTLRNGVPELYMIQPFQYPYDDNGNFLDSLPVKQSSNYGPAFTTWTQNFLGEAQYDNTRLTDVQNHIGALKLRYNIMPGLVLQSSNSLNYMGTDGNSYLDPRSYSGKYGGYPYLFNASSPKLPNGTLDLSKIKYLDYLTSNTLNYHKNIGKHAINALIGQEWGKRTTETMSISMNTLLPGERNLGAAKGLGGAIAVAYSNPYLPSGNFSERATFSVFGQTDYVYAQKYMASVSVRTDATTNFGRQKRYGTFYSVSGGWMLSKESFMADLQAVNSLKLRASYGTSGRDLGDGYLNTTFYQDNLRYEQESQIGSRITQLANPAISWETMYNTNIGIDASLFNRISMGVDVYHKRSSGLLQNVSLTSAQGSLTQYQNVGEIINRGLEVMLNAHAVKSKDFNWNVSLNISFNRNELSNLYQDSLRDSYSGLFYRKIGEDINVIKAITFAGINPENGNMQHWNMDANGQRVLVEGIGTPTNAANWEVVGSATPKYFGGFINTFQYKEFSLSAEWWFQYGNYVMMSLVNNFQSPTAPRLGRNNVSFGNNQRLWSGPGDTQANYPDIFSTSPNAWSSMTFRSSRLWGNASHARLRNVRLSYELPKNVLGALKVANATLYVSGDNLYVIKHKDFVGADPEGATLSTNTAYGGVGTGFANPRRFLIGIQASF